MSAEPGPYSIGSDNWPGLAKLAEECGEVIQVIGKLIAMGGAENYDHWDGSQLRDRLQEEIADVLAAAAFVVTVNDLDWLTINARTDRKKDLFHRWHNGRPTRVDGCACGNPAPHGPHE